MSSYLEIANSAGMWLVCGIVVAWVFLQAIIFTKKAFEIGPKIGLSKKQLRLAFESAVISAIGPSLAILIGALALIYAMGGPIAWMRLSVIGSVMYELMAANFGAQAMGTELGGPGFNEIVYANGVWTMTLGCLGWLVFTGAATHKLETIRLKLAGGKIELVGAIAVGAMLGAFAKLTADHLVKLGKPATAAIVGMIVMIVLFKLSDKLRSRHLKEFSLAISMLTGMFIAALSPW